jgi:RNA polymerase subunit RPABC4/transcription elongation factor Spt4
MAVIGIELGDGACGMVSLGHVRGLRMVEQHCERCTDHETEACSICRGEMSDEFVERMQIAAAQPGKVMTADEFSTWLGSIDTGSPDPQ